MIQSSLIKTLPTLLCVAFHSDGLAQSQDTTSRTLQPLIVEINIFSGRPNPFFWLDDASVNDKNLVVDKIKNSCSLGGAAPPPKISHAQYGGIRILSQSGQSKYSLVAKISGGEIRVYDRAFSSVCLDEKKAGISSEQKIGKYGISYLDNSSNLEKKLVQIAYEKGLFPETVLTYIMKRIEYNQRN